MPHTTPTQAAAVLTESEIEAVVYSLCPDFDDAHEGPSMDSMVDLVRWAEQEILKKLGAQEPVAQAQPVARCGDACVGQQCCPVGGCVDAAMKPSHSVPDPRAAPTPALLGASVRDEWKQAMLDGLANHCIDAPIGMPPADILKRIIDAAVMIATAQPQMGASVGEPSEVAGLNRLLNKFASACAFGDDEKARIAAGNAIRELFAARASSSAQAVEDATDAARYRWLRKQVWNEAPMCVIMRPKANARLGSDCPALGRLDDAIDAARAGGAA